MPRLGVNVDHIATLREARYRGWKKGLPPEPGVLEAARVCAKAGASGITVHLREDRRHIQEADVRALRRAFQSGLNLEMAVTETMVRYAVGLGPDEVCLVPENRREVTTEGGLNLLVQKDKIARSIARLKKAGIFVSAFIDPQERQVHAAAAMGADIVELHTGAYANAVGARAVRDELARQKNAAVLAHGLGLQVNAGHGLHYSNVGRYVRAVPYLHTLNIGHAIVARAFFDGLRQAVREMLLCMKSS